MEKEFSIFGMSRKSGNMFIGGILLLSIISFIFSPTLLQVYWPYLVMMFFLLLAINAKDTKLIGILLIILMSLMFLMQIAFYYVIPLTNNYQPTPTLPKAQIFDLAGKFQISYYPDIPREGDQISLYFELCDIGLVDCIPCETCTLEGGFQNEIGDRKILFSNTSTNTSEAIMFPYPGKRVEVKLDFEGINKKYDKFYIPKLTFWQSIIYFYKNNILFSIIGLISLVAFIGGIPFAIHRWIKVIDGRVEKHKENKIKKKIKEMLKN